MTSIRRLLLCTFFCLASLNAHAGLTLEHRIAALEPIIGAYPPNVQNSEELETVKATYESLMAEMNQQVAARPRDLETRFLRGHLQALGHNFDYPGASTGASEDLLFVLNQQPSHIPALLELGQLWVNSDPRLAPNAEDLFRAAQCYKGTEPVEDAQRGLFFAFYYQGKVREALSQAEYLSQTWPGNEGYRQLVDMARSVVKARGKAAATGATKMSTCTKKSTR